MAAFLFRACSHATDSFLIQRAASSSVAKIAFLAIAFVFSFAPQSMAQFGIGQLGQESTGSPKGQKSGQSQRQPVEHLPQSQPGQ